METHDCRVIEARAALAEARRREPGALAPGELRAELARFRTYVRWLIDLADDAADTDFNEHISQVMIHGGIYIAPADTFKFCAGCQRLIQRIWGTYDPARERACQLHFAGPDEAVAYLTKFWGEQYAFYPPTQGASLTGNGAAQAVPGEKWIAIARFGSHDELKACSPEELLEEVGAHFTEHRRATISAAL
jgi:hypothetical protein